ncbi:MAG: amidohydrolase family protein [Candidatus Heimdallarchaeota archaeon]
MRFNRNDPLSPLLPSKTAIWDAHTHIWDAEAFTDLEKWGKFYGVKRFLGIAQPDVKKSLEDRGKNSEIVFAYYLSPQAFAEQEPDKLLDYIDEAHTLEYSMVKMWFAPRFLDFFNATKPFSISDPIFEPVFHRIEEYDLPFGCHVADPDVVYEIKYTEAKYRTKTQALNEFLTVLRRHPRLRGVSIHFGSLPEIQHHNFLSSILDDFPSLYIDTASSKWIIRELGQNIERTRSFITRYQRRILFATDLMCGYPFSPDRRPDDYYASRYWAQRLFWETDVRDVELPFPDDDNPHPPSLINGLKLKAGVLDRLYWKNAVEFFNGAT